MWEQLFLNSNFIYFGQRASFSLFEKKKKHQQLTASSI